MGILFEGDESVNQEGGRRDKKYTTVGMGLGKRILGLFWASLRLMRAAARSALTRKGMKYGLASVMGVLTNPGMITETPFPRGLAWL